jgi:hypothetical protein
LLVDTEALVLKAKVHVANVADQEGIESLLDGARELFARLKHCGWTPVTGVRRRAKAGSRRFWGGAWISSNVRRNPLQRTF